MGAMTQFVPVWSGVPLHSRRLSGLQLWLVTVGLLGFATALLTGRPTWLVPSGVLMALGFWVFVYNLARTLATAGEFDVTERHFAVALVWFSLVPGLGLLLALDLTVPVFGPLSITRPDVVASHATLAVFGAVLTTVLGALYQLATMFTQTELHGVDGPLRRFEEVGYPLGVALLAGGRLFAWGTPVRVGAVLVTGSLLGFSVIIARRLYQTQVDWTPMLSRYAVVAVALPVWSVAAGLAWLVSPLSSRTVFGAPGTTHLLGLGVVGFVVLGTLYHVIPFIVWVHRYSDRLGYEPVPMVDDLYSARLAVSDFASLVSGTVLLVATDWVGLPSTVSLVGGSLVLVGVALFTVNVCSVVRNHSPRSLPGVLSPRLADACGVDADRGEKQ